MEGTNAHTGAEIVVSDLSKSFGKNRVLDHFNLELKKGEDLVVLGRSGSGKSVLIKCIIGLLKPDSGSINVFDREIGQMDQAELDHVRMRVGFLFQSNALYDSMTVMENLEFPMRKHGLKVSAEESLLRVNEALANVGLEHTINMMPSELSGGMQKRIALARALILKPEIILYDEPTAGLDPVTGKEISELIVEIKNKYKTSSIIISHDMKCVKATADKIIMLINGKCYARGTYAELEQMDDKNIKQFFE